MITVFFGPLSRSKNKKEREDRTMRDVFNYALILGFIVLAGYRIYERDLCQKEGTYIRV